MFIVSRRNQRWGCRWEQGVQGLLFVPLLLSDSLASWSVKAGQEHMWSVQLLFWILNTQYHPTLPTPSSPLAAAREHLQCFYARQPQPRDSKWKLQFFPGKPLLDLGGPEDYHLRLAAWWSWAGHLLATSRSRVAGSSSLSEKCFCVSKFAKKSKQTHTKKKKSHLLSGPAMFRRGRFLSCSHLRHQEGSDTCGFYN